MRYPELQLKSLENYISSHEEQTLNTILENNAKLVDGDITLWLADAYDTIPDYHGSAQPGTDTPIDP